MSEQEDKQIEIARRIEQMMKVTIQDDKDNHQRTLANR